MFSTTFTVDPDYPYRYNATKGQWLHWLVVNIPGKNIDQGKTLAEYVGAKPLPSIGKLKNYFYEKYFDKAKNNIK